MSSSTNYFRKLKRDRDANWDRAKKADALLLRTVKQRDEARAQRDELAALLVSVVGRDGLLRSTDGPFRTG